MRGATRQHTPLLSTLPTNTQSVYTLWRMGRECDVGGRRKQWRLHNYPTATHPTQLVHTTLTPLTNNPRVPHSPWQPRARPEREREKARLSWGRSVRLSARHSPVRYRLAKRADGLHPRPHFLQTRLDVADGWRGHGTPGVSQTVTQCEGPLLPRGGETCVFMLPCKTCRRPAPSAALCADVHVHWPPPDPRREPNRGEM